MKKRVTIFVHCYPPAKGGVEYLTQQIKKVLDQDFQVSIVTGKGVTLDSYKTFSGFINENTPHIHRLNLDFFRQRIANKILNKIIFKIGFFSPFYFGPILKYSPKVLKLIRESDVILGMGMPTKMFVDAFMLAKKFHKKLILLPAYHNISYYNNCSFFQKAFDYASKIITLTPLEETELLKNYKIDLRKIKRITFCPFTKADIKSRDSLNTSKINKTIDNFKKGTITIGSVGQITPRKNLVFFQEFLQNYLPVYQKNKIKLRIILSGARTNSSSLIENMFESYIKSGVLKIHYDFPNKTKEFSYYDISVSPSIEESLGIVNFESIFFGIPIFIHQQSAFSSLLKTHNTQFSTPTDLHKEIISIFKNPQSISKIFADQYSVFRKHNYDQFYQSFRKLIQTHL